MPIKTHLKSLTPRRQQYKKEITLLSHGYSNPQAWPNGKLTVYPWDNSIDQYLIENVRKQSKQEIVFSILKQCCDLNGGSVDDFVAEEINIVLLVSRALSTDGVVMYTARCPFCSAEKKETIRVPDELEKVGEKAEGYPGFDVITLPMSTDVIKLTPLLVKDEKAILNRPDEQRKNVPDAELRTLMRVNSINDSKPDTLEELVIWYRALHAKDAKMLEDEGRALTPHLNTLVPHVCDDADCGKKFSFPLNFDQEFFR